MYAWLRKHPAQITALSGTSKFQRINDFHQNQLLQLDIEDWYAIVENAIGNKVP